MRVFNYEKYCERCRELAYTPSNWALKCNGAEAVDDKRIGKNGETYDCCPTWTIEVPDKQETPEA